MRDDGDGFRITTLHAWLAVGEDGDEGVCAFRGPDGVMMPLVMADEARMASVLPLARQIARQTGRRLVLARFTGRADVDEIGP